VPILETLQKETVRTQGSSFSASAAALTWKRIGDHIENLYLESVSNTCSKQIVVKRVHLELLLGYLKMIVQGRV